jgi:LuxR family maltose regulon positive regulatory protein
VTERFFASVRFEVPGPPPAEVGRQRLVDALIASPAPTTIVTGSPGAGKTAVLTAWVAQRSGPTVWLSCDPSDADPVRFWAALAHAVQRVLPDAGADALVRLDGAGRESPDTAASLAGDCAGVPGLAIVLDDFHHAGAAPGVFSTFVQALPGQARLVLASRQDPSFPIGRLRVQGRLFELRDADLRFDIDEAGQLLSNLGIDVDATDLARLCALTEGWAAGLQLAALSMATRPDVEALTQAFAESDRALADFLANEVIDAQPPDVATFLMETSVLETFDGALCDAVTGRDDSGELLERLHRSHLFLSTLDRRPGWYRYHHLFGAFLQARLRASSRQRLLRAHALASEALAGRGDLMGAVEHATDADDLDLAMDLMRRLIAAGDDVEARELGIDTARAWLRRYGDSRIDSDVHVLLECCIVLNALGVTEDADLWLRKVEQRAARLAAEDRALLRGIRAFHALHAGDPERALGLIEGALRDVSEEAMGDEKSVAGFWLAQLPVAQCHAAMLMGDVGGVQRIVEQARRQAWSPAVIDAVRLPGCLAWAAAGAGELSEARRQAELAFDAARSMGLADENLGWVVPRLALAVVALEQDDLAEADRLSTQVAEEAVAARRPPIITLAMVARARVATALRRHEEALAHLDAAGAAMPASTRAITERLDLIRAGIALETADPRAAALVDGLRPGAERNLLEVRLALAAGDRQAATAILAERSGEAPTRRHSIELGLLTARALVASDRQAAAAEAEKALVLAEPVGMVRAVVDEGPEVHALIEGLPTDARLAHFVERVLRAARRMPAAPPTGPAADLVEPLSEREVEVLRYLASRLTNAEIAAELFISVNTLKSHVKAVYRKLGVSTRAEAVGVARRIGLL